PQLRTRPAPTRCATPLPYTTLFRSRASASLSFGLVRPDGVKTGENKPNCGASLVAAGRIGPSPNGGGTTFLVVGPAPDGQACTRSTGKGDRNNARIPARRRRPGSGRIRTHHRRHRHCRYRRDDLPSPPVYEHLH